MKISFDDTKDTPAATPDPTSACPVCGGKKIRRSRTKPNETFINRVFYRHYRCRNCRARISLMDSVRVFWSVGGTVLLAGFAGVVFWLSQMPPPSAAPAQQEPPNVQQLEQQALNGDIGAELQLGLLYHNSQHTPNNARKAAKWFKKAAEHGSAEGAYGYGMALLAGQGVLVSYGEALRWLEKSARLGYSRAQFELGNIYRFKAGIEPDLKQAYLWYSLAAAAGMADAAIARDAVAAYLTPQEILDLQNKAKEISIQH